SSRTNWAFSFSLSFSFILPPLAIAMEGSLSGAIGTGARLPGSMRAIPAILALLGSLLLASLGGAEGGPLFAPTGAPPDGDGVPATSALGAGCDAGLRS